MRARRIGNQDQVSNHEGTRWRSRPILSVAIRLSTVMAPAAAAAAVAIAISHLLPVPRGTAEAAAWWGLFLATTVATWVVCASLLYKLLPLATLLDLTLLFPDAAPSRFAVLRRTANPHQLERELRRAEEMGPGTEPARRALRLAEAEGAATLAAEALTVRGLIGDEQQQVTGLSFQALEQDAEYVSRGAATVNVHGDEPAVVPVLVLLPGRLRRRPLCARHHDDARVGSAPAFRPDHRARHQSLATP